MAKIFGSSSFSSSSNTSHSASNSGSFSSGFSSSSKFASLSSFTGKFTATTLPAGALNRQGALPDGLQQQQGMTDAFDVGNRSTTAYTTSPFQRLQRLVLQDRVMLSPAEATQTMQNPSLLSQAEQGATSVSFFGKIGKALFGIALLPLLPIIGLYKLGDYAVASLKKGKPPSASAAASGMPAPMPPPPQAPYAPSMGMGQPPQPPAPNAGQAPPPATTSQASELPLSYGKVVNVPSESAIDPVTPIQFV
jgi:hypothetical protein